MRYLSEKESEELFEKYCNDHCPQSVDVTDMQYLDDEGIRGLWLYICELYCEKYDISKDEWVYSRRPSLKAIKKCIGEIKKTEQYIRETEK